MAETLAIFYAFGGLAGLLVSIESPRGGTRTALIGLALVALGASAVAAWWGPRWPRPFFHAPVLAATLLITTAVVLCPEPPMALTAAILISFVVVDAHLFFSGPLAFAHLMVAVLGTTAALLVSDVSVSIVLALDLILVALGVVIRRLVIRASSASRDPLTGLANRRGFDEALSELMAEVHRTGEPLSAVLLDLDHFKAINDTHGHEAGDRMLCRVSDTWQQEVPAGAVLARHGGDEFSLVLPRTTGDAALALVRRVCALHPDLALSCGVAAYRLGETASQLMRRADRALYDAKAAGRGRAALDGAPRHATR
jgi:diguanylate cyclase (GGDEF)-like protein